MIVIWLTDCQPAEPPAADRRARHGAVDANRGLIPAGLEPGVVDGTEANQRLALGEDSRARRPRFAADQFAPPSVDVSCSYPAIPEPGASVDPDAETVTDATFFHALDPPITAGSVGGAVSMRTVSCTHADALPAASTASNRTSVSP